MGQLRRAPSEGVPPAQGPRFGFTQDQRLGAGRPDHLRGVRGSPGNSYTWVELRDDLTVSLLQARLIELNLPISVEIERETEMSAVAPMFATWRHHPCSPFAMGPQRLRRATKLPLGRDQVAGDDSRRPY